MIELLNLFVIAKSNRIIFRKEFIRFGAINEYGFLCIRFKDYYLKSYIDLTYDSRTALRIESIINYS